MMQGVVNQRCEATLPLVVGNANILWDGQYREIDVAESETDPLIGMSLLYKYGLRIDAVEGGSVRVEAL